MLVPCLSVHLLQKGSISEAALQDQKSCTLREISSPLAESTMSIPSVQKRLETDLGILVVPI